MSVDTRETISRLKAIGDTAPFKRDRGRIGRFVAWAERKRPVTLDRRSLIEFGSHVGTRAVLADLERSLAGHTGFDATFLRELRAAVLDYRRKVDGQKMVLEICDAPFWRPFAEHCDLDMLDIHEIKRLDAWLSWAHAEQTKMPSAEDYLRYVEQKDSEATLEALKRIFDKLAVPRTPATEIELLRAIARKRHSCRYPDGRKQRQQWPRTFSVSVTELPFEWKRGLDELRRGESPAGKRPPATGTLKTMEKALRALCWTCRKAGEPYALTPETLRLHLDEITARGRRASAREIEMSYLRRFMEQIGTSQDAIAFAKGVEKELRQEAKGEVPLKFGTLSRIATHQQILNQSVELLAASRTQKSLELRIAKAAAAAALALECLLPLRSADTTLKWGVNLWHTGERYRIMVKTSKTGHTLQSDLVELLTPFLDALLLQGCDERFLPTLRRQAVEARTYVFAHANGRALSPNRVANLWARHVGCKPHIARTLVHTELGKLGPDGVAQALALCAQRDPKTAQFYQGKALSDALLLKSEGILLEGFTDEEIANHFPAHPHA